MAAPTGNLTMLNFLTQQKYPIPCNDRATNNTTNLNWPKLRTGTWVDFTLNGLISHFGITLCNTHVENLPLQLFVVSSDMIPRNVAILQNTLRPAQTHLNIYPNELHHEYSSSGSTVSFNSAVGSGGKVAASHIVQILNDPRHENLVIGLRRPSSKWTGQKLKERIKNNKDLTATLQWPIRQLAHACKLANARYGYIQTEEDLTVCKFSPTNEQWIAEIEAIPWTNSGPNVLTTDLGLWWLCTLALEDHWNTLNAGGTGTDGGQMPITTQTATDPMSWFQNAAGPGTVPPADFSAGQWDSTTLPNLVAANAGLFDVNDLLSNTDDQNRYFTGQGFNNWQEEKQ